MCDFHHHAVTPPPPPSKKENNSDLRKSRGSSLRCQKIWKYGKITSLIKIEANSKHLFNFTIIYLKPKSHWRVTDYEKIIKCRVGLEFGESGIQEYVLLDLLWRVEVSVKVVVIHWAGNHVNTVILRCVFDQQNLLKILPESCTNTHDQLPDSHEKNMITNACDSNAHYLKMPLNTYDSNKYSRLIQYLNTHYSNKHSQLIHYLNTHYSNKHVRLMHYLNTHYSNKHSRLMNYLNTQYSYKHSRLIHYLNTHYSNHTHDSCTT